MKLTAGKLEKMEIVASVILSITLSLIILLYVFNSKINYMIITSIVIILVFSIISILLYKRQYYKFGYGSRSTLKYLNLLYLVLYASSLICLFNEAYVRPVTYFIIISFIFLILIYESVIYESKLSIVKIIALSINLNTGLFLKFPAIGGDSHYWYNSVAYILQKGNCNFNFSYLQDFPIFSINSVIHMLIYNTGYESALISSFALSFSIIIPLFTYILVKKIFNNKIGLLSSILVIAYVFNTWLLYNPSPYSISVMFIPIILYLLFSYDTHRYGIPLFIMILAICFSHILTIFITLIVLLLFIVGITAVNNGRYTVVRNVTAFTLLILLARFITFSIAPWLPIFIYSLTSVVNSIIEKISLDQLFSPQTVSLSVSKGTSVSPSVSTGVSSPVEQILTSLGPSLLLGLSFFGILKLYEYKNKKSVIIFVTTSSVITAIALISFFFGIDILPYRWLGPVSLFLCVFAAIGILSLSRIGNNIVLGLFVAVFIFLLITNPIANIDNPFYGNQAMTRWMYTYQEINGADWSYGHSVSVILTDLTYNAYYRKLPAIYGYSLASNIYNNYADSNINGIICIRDYIFNRPFYGYPDTKFSPLDYANNAILISLQEDEKTKVTRLIDIDDKIYDNGQVRTIYSNNISKSIHILE
jgi:hypothetical protein